MKNNIPCIKTYVFKSIQSFIASILCYIYMMQKSISSLIVGQVLALLSGFDCTCAEFMTLSFA